MCFLKIWAQLHTIRTLLRAIGRLPSDVCTPASIYVSSHTKTIAIFCALIFTTATCAVHAAYITAYMTVGNRWYHLVRVVTASSCEENLEEDE